MAHHHANKSNQKGSYNINHVLHLWGRFCVNSIDEDVWSGSLSIPELDDAERVGQITIRSSIFPPPTSSTSIMESTN
ncbi:hypothetical protein Pyn_08905 [Prunus yedoensis var. nudiflora]|uniref:Uncharacterized protein n=1 Tax=Prunus yedoensis var. nudiflora TaxID=2094558 RepID=A0A314ZE79_PRUYE|nr:hypothetical protein Pyn_08905 [Prunus yedoensis var. nudiflora]